MKRFFIYTALGALFFLSTAQACRDPLAETTTLFETLPFLNDARPVVAKVEILAPEKSEKMPELRAKIIEGIKRRAILRRLEKHPA